MPSETTTKVKLDSLKGGQMNVIVYTSRTFRVRIWLTLLLLRLAAYVSGLSIEISHDDSEPIEGE